MFISKNSFIKAILSLCATGVVAGCNLPSPQNKEKISETTPASFTAQAKAEQSKALETKVQGTFALPASKVFNFTACLKDNAYDKIIAGHDFLIEDTQQKITTDKSGCITWDETIPYNFLGESQYVRIERKIKGLGVHKGSQKVAFAINPWSHGENLTPVLNPDDGNIPKLVENSRNIDQALKGYSTNKELITRPLWVEESRLFITEQKLTSSGAHLLIELRPNVGIQLTKMNEEVFLRALTAGSFSANFALIHVYQKNNQEVRRILGNSEDIHAEFNNGTLSLKSVISLAAIPTGGQLMLGLKLEPLLGPPGLKGFEGVYMLGDFDQLKGNAFLKLNSVVAQTKNFKLQNFVNAQMNDLKMFDDQGKVVADAYQKAGIQISSLKFDEPHVGAEKLASKEFIYKVTACLKNSLDRKATLGRTFKVTKFRTDASEKEVSELIKPDVDSCIVWSERLTYNSFECNHFIKGFISIQNEDLGMNEVLHVAINPWDAMGSFGRDLRRVTEYERLPYNCAKEDRPRSQILIRDFGYSTLGYNYQIDNFLNLTLIKKLQLKIEPRVLEYSNIFYGRDEQERRRDGIYLLKLALTTNKEYDSNAGYITSTDKLVAVVGGQINTDITFAIQDLKSLGNRNNILVELHPVDESKVINQDGKLAPKDPKATLDSVIDSKAELEAPTFHGPITLNIEEAVRPLKMLDASSVNEYLLSGKGQNIHSGKYFIRKLVTEGQRILNQKKQQVKERAQKDQFIKDNNLAGISLRGADEQAPLTKALLGNTVSQVRNPVSKEDLKVLVSEGILKSSTAEKLCAFWFNDYFHHLYREKGGVINKYVKGIGYDCARAVEENPRNFFQVEQHLLVNQVAAAKFVQGQNQGLTVGTSFSLTAAHTKAKTQSTSIGIKAGLSKKFLDLFSVGLDAGWTFSWTTSDTQSASNAININRATSMTVQQNTFKIRTEKYELCMIVRLNPLLFIKDEKTFFARRNYLDSFNQQLSDEEKMIAATRGLMICDGEYRTQPMDLTENYYLIAQETSSTQMQDNGDARNRTLFLALRSNNDFNRFLVATRGQLTMPSGAKKEEEPHSSALRQMEKLFQLSGPSYPGMFRVR